MITPFSRPPADLTEEDHTLLRAALHQLESGLPLYEVCPGDISHVWWTVGLIINLLRQQCNAEQPLVSSFIELGINPQGLFTRIVTPENPEAPVSAPPQSSE